MARRNKLLLWKLRERDNAYQAMENCIWAWDLVDTILPFVQAHHKSCYRLNRTNGSIQELVCQL